MHFVQHFEIKEKMIQLGPESGPEGHPEVAQLHYLYFDEILISKAANKVNWGESLIATGFCFVCGIVDCGSHHEDTLSIKKAAECVVFCPSIWLEGCFNEHTVHEACAMSVDLYKKLGVLYGSMPHVDGDVPELTHIDLLHLLHNEAYANNQPVFYIEYNHAIVIDWEFILCTSTDDAWVCDILKRTLDCIIHMKSQPIALKEIRVSENECFSPVFYIGQEITAVTEWAPLCVIGNEVYLQLAEGLLAGPFLTTDLPHP